MRRFPSLFAVALTLVFATFSLGQNVEFRSSPINNPSFAPGQRAAFDNDSYSEPGIFRPSPHTIGKVREANAGSSKVQNQSSISPVQPASFTSVTTTSPALKPPKDASKEGRLEKPSSSWVSMLSMLVSLLVVIGLFLIVARVLRGIQPTPQRNLPKEVVEVLGRSTLAPRQQMYVVRFGRKLLLVSQQMGQSTTLSEIDDTREVDHMLGLLESKKSDSITDSFRDVLQQISFGTKKREPRSELASTGRHVKSNFDSLG